jgi:hypothetical protein
MRKKLAYLEETTRWGGKPVPEVKEECQDISKAYLTIHRLNKNERYGAHRVSRGSWRKK